MIVKTQILLILLLTVHINCQSQITMQWKLNSNKTTAEIAIKNTGSEVWVVPVHQQRLQAFFTDNCEWPRPDLSERYPFLAPTLNVFDVLTDERIETVSSFPYSDLTDFEKFRKRNDSLLVIKNLLLNEWMNKNHLTDKSTARHNVYFIKNLIFLKPQEEVRFEVPFSLFNITRQEDDIHDSYILQKDKNYALNLSICIDEALYHIMSKKQKRKLGRGKLFTGKIESNTLIIKSNNHENPRLRISNP
ncbi:MAG: hypothetical protein K0M56_02300 [Kaistella sp.]|nr:hypothetical protein [Kaistella sp.]